MKRPLVIGIGNRARGDDAAGPLVVDELRTCSQIAADLLTHGGDLTELPALWEDRPFVVVADAVLGPGTPGSVIRLPLTSDRLGRDDFASSTHAFGLGSAIELGRALGLLPERLVIFGICGEAFGLGSAASAAVRRGVVEAARMIRVELAGADGA